MNLELTIEQRNIQEQHREFAEASIIPAAAEWDRIADYPRPLFEQAAAAGLANRIVPACYGGRGLSVLDATIGNEELGYGCTGISTALTINELGLLPLLLAGSEDQKAAWLPGILADREVVSFCVTEPEAGSDVAALQTTAAKQGDLWVLNGTKLWITGGNAAAWLAVFAVTDPDRRHEGLSCFFVRADAPGIARSGPIPKMGQRAAPAVRIEFQDCAVPDSHMLGDPGSGFLTIMRTFDTSRPLLCAQAVGLARRARDEAVAYAGRRHAFGQSISRFQGVGFMLADMDIRVAAGRGLVRRAAWLRDMGAANTREAAIAKAYCGEAAMSSATDAVQVFGGVGYSAEQPVEKLMRDAKIFQIYEGTTQIQQQIIVRELYRS